MRRGLATVAGVAWLVTLPMAADALLNSADSWATIAFVPAALGSAGAWWLHMRERRSRIGLAGAMAGWLFIGSLALLGVSGFLWVLVGVGLVASTLAYGVLLLVTQSRAVVPALDLVAGVALFAGAGATAIFTATTGMGNTEAWWLPAHWILAVAIGVATVASGLSSGEGA
ncbi:MAG: hypothetical protein ACRDE6_02330 [Candidatus Limnocylindria bacterium]